jgi:hypothetical protein
MDRRAFLSSGATVVLAGCSSNGDQSTTGASGTTTRGATTVATDASTATATADATATTDATATAEPETEAGVDSEPARVDMSVEASWATPGEELDLAVTNETTDEFGAVDLSIRWYDNKRQYLGYTTKGLLALGPGKTWETVATPETPYRERKMDVAVTGTALPSSTPDGLELEIRESRVDAIEGRLYNRTAEEQDATLLGMGYDDEYLGYTGAVSTAQIPGDNFWRFRLPLSRVTPRYIDMNETQVILVP